LYIKYKVLLFYSGASIGLLISQSLFPGYLFEISGDPGGGRDIQERIRQEEKDYSLRTSFFCVLILL